MNTETNNHTSNYPLEDVESAFSSTGFSFGSKSIDKSSSNLPVSTSGFSASTVNQSAFGQSAFSKPAVNQPPLFGQSAFSKPVSAFGFGQYPFGQFATNAFSKPVQTEINKPVYLYDEQVESDTVTAILNHHKNKANEGNLESLKWLANYYYTALFLGDKSKYVTTNSDFANTLKYLGKCAEQGDYTVVSRLKKLYVKCIDKDNMIELLVTEYDDTNKVIQKFIDRMFESYSESSIKAWDKVKKLKKLKSY
jgi:hypothetical protein